MKVGNTSDQQMVIAFIQVVVEPGEDAGVPAEVGQSLREQGWSAGKPKGRGKVADVKDAP